MFLVFMDLHRPAITLNVVGLPGECVQKIMFGSKILKKETLELVFGKFELFWPEIVVCVW